MKFQKFLYVCSFGMFLWAGVWTLQAFHLDFEVHNPGHDYEMEKGAFERARDGDWNSEFPSFADWFEAREAKEAQHKLEFGIQCSELFDIFNLNADDYAKMRSEMRTDQSYSAQAPENWNRAERD